MTKRLLGYARAVRRFLRTLWRVIAITWQVSPRLYLVMATMTVVQGLLPLASAYLAAQVLGRIADHLLHPGQPLAPVLWLFVALAAIGFIISQLSYWSFWLDDVFGMQFNLHVQRQLFLKLHELDQSYYEDQAFNNQLNKLNQNLYAMRALNRNVLMTGNSLVQLMSTGVALLAFEPWIALSITVALIPMLVVEVRTSMLQWRTWETKGEDWRLQSYLRFLLTDLVNLREIKLFGLKGALIKRWETHFARARRAEIGVERQAQGLRAATSALEIAVNTGSQIWLLLRVLERGTGLSSFVFYRQIIENYANASSALVRNLHSMQENSLYVNDYFDLLKLKPRLSQVAKPVVLPASGPSPRIEFDKVSFTYPRTKVPVLRDISLTIEPGEALAIVGANGAGKTTLIKLLLRLYDPTEGRILVDGRDLRELDLASWYQRIGALFQDFNRYSQLSVKDNIMLGRPERSASAEALKGAAKQAGVDKLIEGYEHGYDQRLDRTYKDGVEPSGGQWQRLALARAFYRNADILILDEPTSAIDAKGEYEVFAQIAKTQRGKTSLIISHRFSTVRNAGTIVVLESGRIREQGSHEELMALKGLYFELFELQATGYR